MGFTVDIKGNASHLDKTIKNVKTSLSAIGSVATTAVTSIAAIGAIGAAGIASFIVSSSKAASSVESLTMQFETLLGGADAAGKRMEEIVKFAASTPFEIPELAATSKLLQTMGGSLLATGEGLRMVGDAAAISGQPLQEVGLHIGRLFNAITSGTSAGESVSRLQELGLMTGTVKREFQSLAEAQKKGTTQAMTQQQAMVRLREVFKSTEGAMARLADTTEGKLSNLSDNVNQLKVAFGKGFNVGLKDALNATNNFLPQLESTFKEAGMRVGSALSEGVRGNTQELALIGGFIGETVWAGVKAVMLKGFDSLLVTPIMNAGKMIMHDPLAPIIGGLGGKVEMPKNLTESSPLASYLQTAMEETSQSGSLSELVKMQDQRKKEADARFMKQYEKMNDYLNGIYKNQSPASARFSN